MAFIDPRKVESPKGRWKLIDVLYDGGDGKDALAIGEWDHQRVLAIRWNGNSADISGVGNPQSRGLPTWFILPRWSYEGLLTTNVIAAPKLSLAKALLEI